MYGNWNRIHFAHNLIMLIIVHHFLNTNHVLVITNHEQNGSCSKFPYINYIAQISLFRGTVGRRSSLPQNTFVRFRDEIIIIQFLFSKHYRHKMCHIERNNNVVFWSNNRRGRKRGKTNDDLILDTCIYQ